VVAAAVDEGRRRAVDAAEVGAIDVVGDARPADRFCAGRSRSAQFLAFSQDAADNRTFLAQGKLQMPVLAFGGEATFGPMIGAVIRCVADNVEDAIIPDCGHWITGEQPQTTTDLVVDFLRRAR
jgi:pimeloyl-ACP methyl ester carboxylesterase